MLTTWSVRRIWTLALLPSFALAQTIVFTPSSTTLNPGGGSLTFTASISYVVPPSVLAFTTTLPAGWTYVSGTNEPPVKPAAGTTGALSWSYITTPASPATFDFTATYPASLTGLQPLPTSTITRDTVGSPQVTTPGPTVTIVAPPAIGLWLGGNGSWTDAGQWSGSVVPNNVGNATFTAQINAGIAALNSAVTLNELQFTGGSIGGTGSLTLVGVTSTWTAGAFATLGQVVIAPGAMITASTAANHDFVGTAVVNQGQFVWQNNGELRSGAGGSFTNASGATFLDNSSGAPTVQISSTGGAFTFTNAGSYVKSGSTETKISAAFTNQGNIAVSAGNLHFDAAFTQTSGSLFIAAGATAQFDLTPNFSAGSLMGGGTISGNVSNSAFLSPGSNLGTLTIQGNLTLLGTSQLFMDIGGTAQGTGHDFLSVSGTVTFGGDLTLNLVNGSQGTLLPTDNLTLLSATSVSGTFNNVANGGRLMATNGISSFQVNFTGTSIVLSQFSAIPEPSTWVLLATGLGGMAILAYRRRAPR